MTADQERWAEAIAIERWKGEAAEAFLAERILALTAARDSVGVDRFTNIADRLAQLREGRLQ